MRITNEQHYLILDELYTSYLSLQEVVKKINDKIVKISCNNINEQDFLIVACLPDLKWCAICMCHSHRWGCVFQINYLRWAHAWSHIMKFVLHSSSIEQLINVWYSVVISGFVFRPRLFYNCCSTIHTYKLYCRQLWKSFQMILSAFQMIRLQRYNKYKLLRRLQVRVSFTSR